MEEVSLEQLKAKLPNLNDVLFSDLSNEYMTKFCNDFPLLNTLVIDGDIEGSDNLSTAISSLQNLRILQLWSPFYTDDQVYTILKNLTNLEDLDVDHVTLSHQSFLSLARMPRLHTLDINLETGYTNLQLFTNMNNFPELRDLTIIYSTEDNNADPRYNEIRTKLATCRPTLQVVVNFLD